MGVFIICQYLTERCHISLLMHYVRQNILIIVIIFASSHFVIRARPSAIINFAVCTLHLFVDISEVLLVYTCTYV